MLNDSSKCSARQDNDPLLAYGRYFDSKANLLPTGYSFVYDQSMDAAKRYNEDLSWLKPTDSLEKRRATAKANGWEVGAGYCRCSTKMQDSYEGQIAACIDRAMANKTIIFPEFMVGDKAVTGKKSDRAGLGLAAALIRTLVNGVVEVSFIRPQGQKGRAFGIGTFTPTPALALARHGSTSDSVAMELPVVTVSFRELPRFARIADEAYRLRTEEGLTLTEIGKRLACGSGNAFGAFAYWHTTRGLDVPYTRKRYKKPVS